jgi:hypothetical protein
LAESAHSGDRFACAGGIIGDRNAVTDDGPSCPQAADRWASERRRRSMTWKRATL